MPNAFVTGPGSDHTTPRPPHGVYMSLWLYVCLWQSFNSGTWADHEYFVHQFLIKVTDDDGALVSVGACGESDLVFTGNGLTQTAAGTQPLLGNGIHTVVGVLSEHGR